MESVLGKRTWESKGEQQCLLGFLGFSGGTAKAGGWLQGALT